MAQLIKRLATLTVAATAMSAGALAWGIVPAFAAGTAVEVCKQLAADSGSLAGKTFHFTVNGTAHSLIAQSGSMVCTAPQSVPTGTPFTVTETQNNRTFQVQSIDLMTGPSGSNTQTGAGTLNSSDLTTGSASVTVTSGTVSLVYTNEIPQGALEVCKYVAPGSPLAGEKFTFDVNGATRTVTAQAGKQACTQPKAVPTDRPIPVSEQAGSGYQVTDISLGSGSTGTGSISNVDTSAGSADVTVTSGTESVVFTNAATGGAIKVCKHTPSTSGIPAGTPFTFQIDGGDTFTVLSGQCGAPMAVTSGQHSVTEVIDSTKYTLTSIHTTVNGGTGPTVTRSGDTGTFTVPTDTEVAVTFTNTTATSPPPPSGGAIKVCKNTTSAADGSGVAAGTPFTFSIDGGPTFQVPAGQCDDPTPVDAGPHTVTEILADSTYTLQSIDTQVNAQPGPAVSRSGNSGTFDVPSGSEVAAIFTNVKTPPPPPPGPTGCTLTKGYYKGSAAHQQQTVQFVDSHGGLSIGGTTLSGQEVENVLHMTESGGNVVLQVEQQLIAAMLNQEEFGASSTSGVTNAMNAAQQLIAANGGALNPSGSGSTTVAYQGQTYTASQLASILDQYNSGQTPGGPPSCD